VALLGITWCDWRGIFHGVILALLGVIDVVGVVVFM